MRLDADAANTSLTMYLNGQPVAQQVLGVRSRGNALPLEIARQGQAPGKYWLGKLDDVRIWNAARTAPQIQLSYRAQMTAPQAGLVANWHFDDGCGALGTDAVGTHTAAIGGAAAWAVDVPTAPAPTAAVVPISVACLPP